MQRSRTGAIARGLALWAGAAALVLCSHVAFAWMLIARDKPKLSAGEPPAAIMADLAPMPVAAAPAPDPKASDTTMRDPASHRMVETALIAVPGPGMARPSAPAALAGQVPSPVAAAAATPIAVPLPVQRPRPRTAPSRTADARQPERMQRRPAPAPVQDIASTSDHMASVAATPTSGAGAAAAQIQSTWKTRLLAHLDRHKRYPANARGAEGVSLLSFTMDREGMVLGFFIARSSGSAALDQETLAMIQRAAPLPAAPGEMPGSRLQFTVPVRFTMR
ncbi:energy transducer TonB family protein [Phreatobacter stygius]|uniref:Energy transducer TonB n=1 Tax=Phreatobacter stygius TaxID=1940610 RepID=A0A4D7B799_9HYPH|nr:energy transducer TonB [Phreatobacter stygius]QCI64022.1 energy transducer TonB [Phreatobacter stygius]